MAVFGVSMNSGRIWCVRKIDRVETILMHAPACVHAAIVFMMLRFIVKYTYFVWTILLKIFEAIGEC
jgi:hypothetical protein